MYMHVHVDNVQYMHVYERVHMNSIHTCHICTSVYMHMYNLVPLSSILIWLSVSAETVGSIQK